MGFQDSALISIYRIQNGQKLFCSITAGVTLYQTEYQIHQQLRNFDQIW